MRVILSCIFGRDVSNIELEYIENGVQSMKPVSYVLSECLHRCIFRASSLQIILFPTSYNWHITSVDRENLRNGKTLRALFKKTD